MPIQTYQQALDWLYSYVRFDSSRKHIPGGGDLGRMERLCARMGAPQARYPSIIIAGTKGKGSTATMLASMLRAAGYRTGLYTSPHLHTFRERIRVDETLISREEIIAGAQRLEAQAGEFPDAIWFELVTALAFEFFAIRQVDIAVLEVGLGGRLDATNIVTPRVSVITSISYDHMEVLGSTLDAIAREKAGVIKAGIPVVSSPQELPAREVIERVAQEASAPLITVGRDWSWELIGANLYAQWFRVEKATPRRLSADLSTSLLGPHQLANATTAIATAHELQNQGWRIDVPMMQQGLSDVQWPARFEILDRKPLTIADGAHNRASAHELGKTLDLLLPGRRVHLVFGASSDKDIDGMFEELLPHAASLTFTHSHHVRAADPHRLEELAARFHKEPTLLASVAEALAHARGLARDGDAILIAGSLFVAAEARAQILAERGTPVESDD